MASLPASPATETIDQRVVRLLECWRQQTAYLSSSSLMAAHPSYRELIALGPEALPSLFRDLERTGDGHLSKALKELTGTDPVPAEDRGRIRRVADAWLRWAAENGYRW